MKHWACLSIAIMTFLAAGSVVSAQFGSPVPSPPKKTFFVDPVRGAKTGDGSAAKPWRTLQEVWESKLINGMDLATGVVHAGDRIYLMSGNHGTLNFTPYAGSKKVANTDFITIEAAPGHLPVIQTIKFIRCSKWVLRGVTVETPDVFTTRPVLVFAENSTNIIIDSNTVQSEPDAVGWSPEDWPNRSAEHGIKFNVVMDSTISNNVVKNVHNGINIRGNSLLVTGNVIDYFANDGIQFMSSNTIIQHNLVTNHYGLWDDGMHHDGMQGWNAAGETFTTNVTIDSNMVLASTGDYPTIPVVPTGDGDDYMQGISVFDGTWNQVTVTNNVVAAAAYHGLSFYGITDSVIANNTVTSQCPKYVCWLGVFKNAIIPQNVIVRNNIAQSFSLPQLGVTFDHNLTFKRSGHAWLRDEFTVVDPIDLFVDYRVNEARFDFRLLEGCVAIGAGSPLGAPEFDFLSVPRDPQRIDIGAYAYVDE